MTSSDDLAEVLRLSGDELSIRAIAKRVGWSRMRVQRAIAAEAKPEAEDGDLDARELALLDATDTGQEPRAPFRFVGMEPTVLEIPGVDTVEPVDVERFLDANGRSVSMEDIYRTTSQTGRGSRVSRRRRAPDRSGGIRPTATATAGTGSLPRPSRV